LRFLFRKGPKDFVNSWKMLERGWVDLKILHREVRLIFMSSRLIDISFLFLGDRKEFNQLKIKTQKLNSKVMF